MQARQGPDPLEASLLRLSYPAPVSGVLRLVGTGLLANAAWMLVQRLSAGGVATGRVVDYEVSTSGAIDSSTEAMTSYRPVIEFTSGQGRHRFTAVGADREPRPKRGTRMRVRFRRGDPETAYVATFSNMWVMPLVWALAGVAVLYLGWR